MRWVVFRGPKEQAQAGHHLGGRSRPPAEVRASSIRLRKRNHERLPAPLDRASRRARHVLARRIRSTRSRDAPVRRGRRGGGRRAQGMPSNANQVPDCQSRSLPGPTPFGGRVVLDAAPRASKIMVGRCSEEYPGQAGRPAAPGSPVVMKAPQASWSCPFTPSPPVQIPAASVPWKAGSDPEGAIWGAARSAVRRSGSARPERGPPGRRRSGWWGGHSVRRS
jgi:hypothetical protein